MSSQPAKPRSRSPRSARSTNTASSPTSRWNVRPRVFPRTRCDTFRPRRASRNGCWNGVWARLRRWQQMTEPNWARVHYPKIDYQNAYYYAAPKNTPLKQSLDEVDPKLLETYKKLGIPLSEQKVLAGVAVDAVFDSVSVATTFKAKLNEAGVIFCPISEAIRDHPDLVKQVSRHRRAGDGQFLRDAQFGGLFRRHVRLCAQGRALPDGTVDLFPHQCQRDGAVRAHADRRRRRFVCELSRRLHRAQARREPASCRRRRTGGAGRRGDQIFDGAELVSGRRERARRHLQFRHQARRLPRRRAPRFPGPRSRPARRSPGNTRAVSCAATIRSASSIRSPSPTISSRPIPAPR